MIAVANKRIKDAYGTEVARTFLVFPKIMASSFSITDVPSGDGHAPPTVPLESSAFVNAKLPAR
jgi:hypothetical protein